MFKLLLLAYKETEDWQIFHKMREQKQAFYKVYLMKVVVKILTQLLIRLQAMDQDNITLEIFQIEVFPSKMNEIMFHKFQVIYMRL